MEHVRVGIIGLGNIGRHHLNYLSQGKAPNCRLTAVATSKPEKAKALTGVEIFTDVDALIQSDQVDAVLIATPHYQHTTLGIQALEAGKHIMVEKPISAHKADAERLIQCHEKHPELVFGGMFQLRAEPRYTRMKKIIDSGELGDIVRVNWIITDWYRTEAYYASGGWRATWKGEGGGVLLNQCLHNLDVMQWLTGMPTKLRGYCQLGQYHDIEVEDNVTAYMEYENGATGVFITSSGEAPGTNRFEIAGTKGKLVLENDALQFVKNEQCMLEFSRTSPIGFLPPDIWDAQIPIANADAPHATLMENFGEAILSQTELIAPGRDGLHSVELANAMLYSSLIGEELQMPLSGADFEAKLNQLIADSKHEKKVREVSTEDFEKSFKR